MFAIDVDAVKTAAKITGSICGNFVTGAVLGSFIPTNSNLILKGVYIVGSGLVGAVVGDVCGEEASKQIGMLCG